MKAATKLNVQNLPAISVFYPKKDELHEASRFEGVYSFDELHKGIVDDLCNEVRKGKADARAWRLWDAPLRSGATTQFSDVFALKPPEPVGFRRDRGLAWFAGLSSAHPDAALRSSVHAEVLE
jgi:hypothetical protein